MFTAADKQDCPQTINQPHSDPTPSHPQLLLFEFPSNHPLQSLSDCFAAVSSEPEAAAPAVAVEASVMELLEAAYPNPVTLDR